MMYQIRNLVRLDLARARARLLLQVFLFKQGRCLQSLKQLPTRCKQPLHLLHPLHPLQQLQQALLLLLQLQRMMNLVCCLQTYWLSQEKL